MNPLPPLGPVATIDQVVAAIQSVIDWTIEDESRLGYFAALYKRITIAIRDGIAKGLFDDGARMERFDVAFASRYFAALNGYFHPGQFPPVSHCWRIAFDAAQLTDPVIVQHMIAGVNAHISLDLGIAAEAIAPGAELQRLHRDFNTVNAVLSSQAAAVVAEIDELSPVLADIYDVLMRHELDLISDALVVVRDRAWAFAALLAEEAALLHEATIMVRDFEAAQLGAMVLRPPAFAARIIEVIAARESGDVVRNIRTLDAIANTAAPMTTTAAAKI